MWEISSVFLWKFLYFITMVCGVGVLYSELPAQKVFLHIILFLTIIGFILNTHLFNPTRDKYYAIVLLRIDAKEYTLVDYFYRLIKDIVGFLPMTLIFGTLNKVPLWLLFYNTVFCRRRENFLFGNYTFGLRKTRVRRITKINCRYLYNRYTYSFWQ